MALSDVATVTIVAKNPGINAAGFGIPLLTSASAVWVERTRTYNDINDVVADFATTTPEYQGANAWFSQTPAPPTVMIGRLANKPVQVFTVGIETVVSVAGTAYKVRLNNLASGAAGAGIGLFATFTTVGSDTNDSIVAGLIAAVTALSITGLTASATGGSGSHVLVLTMTTGLWLGVELFDTSLNTVGNLMIITETGADPGVTADLTAINLESSVWYGLNLLFKSTAIVLAAAAWTESNLKLFIPAVQETNVAIVADGSASDIAHQLKAASRKRTAPFFHPRNDEFADCAEVGYFFPIDPGGDNWILKPLSGPTPVNYTATQVVNLDAKNCNFYYTLGASGSGTANVIGGAGKCSNGDYIDYRRFLDWYAANLQADLVNLLIGENRVDYDDAGIAQIEDVIRTRNTLGENAGGIVPGSETIQMPKAANVAPADMADRTLNDANTSWTYTNGIDKINVNVAVTL